MPAQPGVYPGSTDFSGVSSNANGPTYAPSYVGVPEYVSKLYWDTFQNGPEVRALRDKMKREHFGGVNEEELKQQIFRAAQESWFKIPKEKQDQWHAQDKKGSTNPPGSPGWVAEQDEEKGESTTAQNLADIDEMGGLDELKAVAADAAEGNQEALDRLRTLVDSIEDPEIKEYIGNYVSEGAKAFVSDKTIADQQREYQKLSGLTDPTITAEERLMQETSRRKQEQDLKSQRGALANEMQARGMYGSGVELSMNLASSQQAAQQRALDEMAAQAHASERAMKALEQANTVAGNIRTGEAQELQYRATAADRASEFNNKLKDAYDKWRTEEEDRQNKAKVEREGTVAEYGRGVRKDKFTNSFNTATQGLDTAKAKVDARNTGYEVGRKARELLYRSDLFNKGKSDLKD